MEFDTIHAIVSMDSGNPKLYRLCSVCHLEDYVTVYFEQVLSFTQAEFDFILGINTLFLDQLCAPFGLRPPPTATL